jgi:hypothetical protein
VDELSLSKCTAACQRKFSRLAEGERYHREWHEARDSFAARELSFPFRRWYERATIDEVEHWHAERQVTWKIIHGVTNVLSLPFSGRLLGMLALFVEDFVLSIQHRRDQRRVAVMQSQG